MIPLAFFLLACAAVYLGCIEASFSALMRFSLRLVAERSGRPGALDEYLDDPLLLFVPVRLLLGLVIAGEAALLSKVVGIDGARALAFVLVATGAVVIVCELLVPLVIVGRDPERILEVLLRSFTPVARVLGPLTRRIARTVAAAKRPVAVPAPHEEPDAAARAAHLDTEARERLSEGEERELLQSIVDFGDTLVREV
ncbi:MAG: hypothetical protein ABUS56_03230, partial [Acidobacteriota bacterium]